MLKKSLISLFIMGCTMSYAGTMGPVCESSNVTVPCENNFWEIGGHALYLQPFTSSDARNRQYYYTYNDTGRSIAYKDGTDSEYNWGFQLEAARHFGKGKDINLNWYHFRGTTDKTYPANQDFDDGAQFAQQNASWDHVNLEYGNLINLEESTAIRLHGGLVWARVASQYIRNTSNYAQTNILIDNNQSAFSGFGARAGMSLIYHLMPNFNLHGDLAAGLLAGTTKSSYLNGNTAAGEGRTLDTYSVHATAPEIDAKAGIEYKYALKNSQILLDAGWLWASYINTLQSNAGANFGIQGVYFGARWNGDLA